MSLLHELPLSNLGRDPSFFSTSPLGMGEEPPDLNSIRPTLPDDLGEAVFHRWAPFRRPAPLPAALAELPVGLLMLDADGRILDFTDAEERPHPLLRERLLGHCFFRLAPWAQDLWPRLREMAQSPGRLRVRCLDRVFSEPGGPDFRVSLTLSPTRHLGQYYLGVVCREEQGAA